MAKLFLIMICVCTTCVHLACAQMARKTPQLSDFNQIHRHDIKLRPQGQQQRLVLGPAAKAAAPVAVAVAPSDLEYGKQIKQTQLGNIKQNYEINQLHRTKRHAGHSHDGGAAAATNRINHIEINPNIGHFIEKLFQQFSNGDSKTMNLIEFEKMMKHLGLDRLIDDQQLNNLIHPTDDENSSSNSNSNIDSTHDNNNNNHDNNHENHHSSDAHSNDTVSRCVENKISANFSSNSLAHINEIGS